MHTKEEKIRLKAAMQERITRLTENQRHAESRTLCRELLHALPKEPKTICAYFPLKDEADVRPLLLELFRIGYTIFLPRFEEGTLAFREAKDLGDLPTGAFNIPEPSADAPALDLAALDLALVPGRAFDPAGNRLGRGNGGYDKWLRRLRAVNGRAVAIGCALECQIVNAVPMEEHDEKVDKIATARGVKDATK